jgi:hypothetical protein
VAVPGSSWWQTGLSECGVGAGWSGCGTRSLWVHFCAPVELKDKPGSTSGLWLCDAVLVALGLHTMSRANKLASLTVANVVVKGPMTTVCVRQVKTNPLS